MCLLAAGATEVLAIVEKAGQVRTATLFSGPASLVQNGMPELAVLVIATTFFVPMAVAASTIYVLVGLKLSKPLPGLRQVFAWRNRLRPWSMVEVFLVGYFVAFAKLGALVNIQPGGGFYALFGFMVATIATDAFLDPHAVWEKIGQRAPPLRRPVAEAASSATPGLLCCLVCHLACQPTPGELSCPRCGYHVRARKPDSVSRTAALAASSLVLYLPANMFPALTVVSLGRGSASTILSGVWELLAAGQLPLAVIVFVASVAIPVLKLLSLAAMLAVVLRRRLAHARQLTKLHRVVVTIGRWSMIDIFMESILGGIVQFGAVARIEPGSGAIAFAAVVVLTVFAAENFDSRLLWDWATR